MNIVQIANRIDSMLLVVAVLFFAIIALRKWWQKNKPPQGTTEDIRAVWVGRIMYCAGVTLVLFPILEWSKPVSLSLLMAGFALVAIGWMLMAVGSKEIPYP